MSYNPHSNVVCGPEWKPTIQGNRPVDSNGLVWAAKGTTEVTETVDNIWLRLGAITTPGRFTVEIYREVDVVCGDVQTDVYYASADLFNDTVAVPAGALWRNEADVTAAGTLYQSIDQAFVYGQTEHLQADADGFNARYAMNFASGGFTNRRVVQVRVVLVWSSFGNSAAVYYTNGVFSLKLGRASFAGVGIETVFVIGETHPITRDQWTPADVKALATTDGIMVINDATAGSQLVSARIEVDSVEENRMSLGTVGFTAVAPNGLWAPFPMQQFAGDTRTVTGWDKVAGQNVRMVVRRVIDPWVGPFGSIGWSYLARDVCPVDSWSAATWQVDGGACTVDATEADYLDQCFAFAFQVGGGWSTDSQPYGKITSAVASVAASPRQLLTIDGAGDYGRLRALVRPLATTRVDLTAQIETQAGDVDAGGAVTLSVADALDLPDQGDGWRLWDAVIDPAATLGNGDAVYVLFVSAAGTAAKGWEIAVLDAVSDVFGDVTFGGITDEAVIDGVAADRADLAVTIAIQPDTPTGFAAVTGTLGILNDGTFCPVDTVDQAELAWDATSLGADFGYYLVERSVNSGPWTPIGAPDDESVTTWIDIEAPRGRSSVYRVSVARADGTLSLPSAEIEAISTPSGSTMLFASNEEPGTALAYNFEGPTRSWSFRDAGFQVRHQWYGRDGEGVYIPTEKIGDTFDLTLMVRFGPEGADPPPGRDVFQALLDLARAGYAYLAVVDPDGNVWYASIAVTEGTRRHRKPGYYALTVKVEEVRFHPTVPTAQL